jgi:hypothetical protein
MGVLSGEELHRLSELLRKLGLTASGAALEEANEAH